MQHTLRIGTFSRSVLLDVTRTLRSEHDDLPNVEEIAATNSPQIFGDLDSGALDATITSPDNVLLYASTNANPLGRQLSILVLSAIDHGLGLSLWTRPGIDLADVRRIGVDVATSGYALAAFALLERHGLAMSDLEIVSLGATPRRRELLINGECDATILNAGSELLAKAAGAHRVAEVTELGPYLGAVLCASQGVAPEVHTSLTRLSSSMSRVADEILDGKHDRIVLESAERLLNLPPSLASAHLDTLRAPGRGLVRDGRVDPEAVATLIRLRSADLDLSNGTATLLAAR